MKICTTCKLELSEDMFYKDKHHPSGTKSSCKICCKTKYRQNIDYFIKYRADNIDDRRSYDKSYVKKNYSKEDKAEYDKKYRQDNADARRQYNIDYNRNNKEKNAEKRRIKYATDMLYAETSRIRRLILLSITNKGYKKSSKTAEILGCSYDEFITHIESQFVGGMSWENRHLWHLDHIYPVSRALDEDHLIKLNHYTNFQPLWAEDNLKKGNTI